MLTKSNIADQVRLERDQIRKGKEKLYETTKKLEEQNYASASIYGSTALQVLIPKISKRVENTSNRIHEGKVGVKFKDLKPFLSVLSSYSCAAITCKIAIDKIFGIRDKSNYVTNIAASIGFGIEKECQMLYYENKVPALLQTLKDNYWHKSTGTDYKVKKIQTLMNRYKVAPWEAWGRVRCVHIGGWLLDCFIEESGWFEKQIKREGRETHPYVVPTPEYLATKDQLLTDAEVFAPFALPMLIPPREWSHEENGGYVLDKLLQINPMVRRGQSHIQGEEPVTFLNKIQKVGYQLNPFIVEVAKYLYKKGTEVGKFIPIVNNEIPPKPVDIDTNKESRHDWRRRATKIRDLNAQTFKRSCRTRMQMIAVEEFEGKEFFLPWSFDYRGRVYPIPSVLSLQDSDFGKSLILFSESAEINNQGKEWLAFQVATTAGRDKDSMSDRQQWVLDNLEVIKNIAEDPIRYIHEWEGVSEPWCHLAACREYYEIVIAKTKTTTNLPIAIDATASGLQILSGLCKCKSTAELVNVIPSSKPQDAYQVIAEKALPHIPERLRPYWDRKCTKRTVMTIPYNAKPFSNRSYIREALKEKGIEIEKDELTQTVKAVRDAMNEIFPGPMAVMKWIEKEVSRVLADGKKYLEWETPSKFTVRQKLNKKDVVRIQLRLLGTVNLRVPTGDGKKVDKAHHRNATAPNLIHSLDASMLHMSALEFNAPIALIHDSVLCRANDMKLLGDLVRDTYMRLFAEHDFLKDFAQQIGAKTEPPIIGDLKPESVIESTYFFC
tara:strand:+ start:257 stop:2590 length:2334 start_codon:yes stop_codon:yes gene_type:complete